MASTLCCINLLQISFGKNGINISTTKCSAIAGGANLDSSGSLFGSRTKRCPSANIWPQFLSSSMWQPNGTMESAEKRLERRPWRLKPLWCGLAGALPWKRQLWLVCQAAERSQMWTEALVNLHVALLIRCTYIIWIWFLTQANQATAGTMLCCIHTGPGRPQEPWPHHRQGWQLCGKLFPRGVSEVPDRLFPRITRPTSVEAWSNEHSKYESWGENEDVRWRVESHW